MDDNLPNIAADINMPPPVFGEDGSGAKGEDPFAYLKDAPTFADSDEPTVEISQDMPEVAAPVEEEPAERAQEEAPAAPAKPAHRPNLYERLSEVQRRNFQQENEINRLRAELERSNQLVTTSTKTALQHYADAAKQRLDSAKSQKIRALESGDIEAQAEADVSLAMASAEYQSVNQLKAKGEALEQPQYQQQQQQYYQEPQQYQQPQHDYYAPANNMHNVEAWASQNSWMHPNSPDYDGWMSEEVKHYAGQLDNNLQRSGMGSKIFSPEYFDVLDKHINALRQQRYPEARNLNMHSAPNRVAPVNSGRPAQARQKSPQDSLKLSKDDYDTMKELARRLGKSEKEYAASIIEDRKLQLQKGRRV